MRRTNLKSLPAVLAAFLLAAVPFPAAAEIKRYFYRVDLAEDARASGVRAGGVTWECRGKRCVARGRGGNVSVRGCTDLARQVGRVLAYRSEIKSLADDQLAACNAAATAARQPVAKMPPAAPAAVPPAAPTKAATTAAAPRPRRVTTDELTFTGVYGAGRR